MSQRLKVSIIVPVYNTADFLEECLESIRLQTYKNFEVLMINDGSTDNSREICECFCKTDFRFKLFNQVQSGLSVSRTVSMTTRSSNDKIVVPIKVLLEPRKT